MLVRIRWNHSCKTRVDEMQSVPRVGEWIVIHRGPGKEPRPMLVKRVEHHIGGDVDAVVDCDEEA